LPVGSKVEKRLMMSTEAVECNADNRNQIVNQEAHLQVIKVLVLLQSLGPIRLIGSMALPPPLPTSTEPGMAPNTPLQRAPPPPLLLRSAEFAVAKTKRKKRRKRNKR
jgi:hypothetical protein